LQQHKIALAEIRGKRKNELIERQIEKEKHIFVCLCILDRENALTSIKAAVT
jgi:hypothetical protein